MTDDIVARLRCYEDINDAVFHPWVYAEAADEIERLRERGDDWRAAMTENHDLWRENERLLEEIQQLKHDSTIFINERSDAICENFDLREENAELREENAELRETAIAALKEEEKKDG